MRFKYHKDIPPHHASEKERERANDVGSDDESAEKKDRGERFFVGCGRE